MILASKDSIERSELNRWERGVARRKRSLPEGF